MTELQRISARLAGMARETERHCDALDDFTGCASGVAGSDPDPEAGNGAGLAHPQRIATKVPYCMTCGDSGRIPNEGPLRWGSSVRFDEDDSLVCPDCPRCTACGAEWSEHDERQECP